MSVRIFQYNFIKDFYFLIALILCRFLDIALTYLIIGYGGKEANYVPSLFIEHFGIYSMIGITVIVFGVLLAALSYTYWHVIRNTVWLAIFLTQAFVIISNLIVFRIQYEIYFRSI